MQFKYDEAKNTYILVPDPEDVIPAPKAEMKQETTEVGKADMESPDILGGITGFAPMGVPIGEAVAGGAAAIVLDRLILSRIKDKVPGGEYAGAITLLAAAWAVKKFKSNLGPFAPLANTTSLILTYEAVADLVTEQIDKVLPVKAGAQQPANVQQNAGVRQDAVNTRDVVREAEMVISSAQSMSRRGR